MTRSNPLAARILLAVALSLATTSARAQDPRPGAEAHFAEGKKLYAQGKIEEARTQFSLAYELHPSANALWNLAVAELHSHHPLDAVRHLRRYVALTDAAPRDVSTAKDKLIPQAEKETSRIRLQASPGARVTIDGAAVEGAAPFEQPVDVAPGTHQVVANDERGTRQTEVLALAGQIVVADVAIPQDAPAAATPTLALAPTPASTPAPAPSPSPSPSPTLPDEPPPPAPRDTSTARLVTTLSLGGAAAVSLGIGAGFLLDAANQQSRANRASEQILNTPSACAGSSSAACADLHAANSTQASDRNAALGFAIAGGVLAAGAAVVWIAWPRSKERANETPPSARVAPALGPGVAGAQVELRF